MPSCISADGTSWNKARTKVNSPPSSAAQRAMGITARTISAVSSRLYQVVSSGIQI